MTAQPFYSMKWENYFYHVSELFHQLLDSGSMSDITLYAEGTKLNCHKILLSACSPYFQEILSNVGSKNAAIIISGIEGEDVRSCIEFIYKGEVNVTADRLDSVLKAAEALKICGLTDVKREINETDPTIIVNNQSEKDSGSKLVLKRQSPLSNNKTKGEISANPNNHKRRSEEERPFIVLPENMLFMKDTEEVVGEICESESENISESTIQLERGNEADSNHLTIELNIDENNLVDCGDLKVDDMRILKRKENRKKLYSEEAMQAALEDMKSGENLVKSAEKHCVPKTTLYCRARAIGACPRFKKRGYPREKMVAALQAVAGGCSLQYASREYGIPKTVLWRRAKKPFDKLRSLSPDASTTVEDNVSIRRVSPQYQIPKATLFRWEKVGAANKETEATFLESPMTVDEEIKEIKGELLSVESENDEEIVEVASSSNMEEDNNDLQVNYLENTGFSNSSIIILSSVEQHNGENKFTNLRGTLSEEIFVKNDDINASESQLAKKD
ncbi:hypothetical protein LSTR_LSTR011666 [Laodelphax striatellus]|uniref:BTB domain-containing protein n=1 Tax=Laodelphax striatellus TaxID=195883 RepID=A0A482WLJ0_LAOST|nr:hypothetical protein LSTR_LSTR011666 [Laodelphax striatellus]